MITGNFLFGFSVVRCAEFDCIQSWCGVHVVGRGRGGAILEVQFESLGLLACVEGSAKCDDRGRRLRRS